MRTIDLIINFFDSIMQQWDLQQVPMLLGIEGLGIGFSCW